MYENDPDKSTEELLSQIKQSCIVQTKGVDSVSLALPTFSALLVKLSNEASATASKNLKIQNRMILLTSVILAISVSQLGIAFFQSSNAVTVNPPSIESTSKTVTTDGTINDK